MVKKAHGRFERFTPLQQTTVFVTRWDRLIEAVNKGAEDALLAKAAGFNKNVEQWKRFRAVIEEQPRGRWHEQCVQFCDAVLDNELKFRQALESNPAAQAKRAEATLTEYMDPVKLKVHRANQNTGENLADLVAKARIDEQKRAGILLQKNSRIAGLMEDGPVNVIELESFVHHMLKALLKMDRDWVEAETAKWRKSHGPAPDLERTAFILSLLDGGPEVDVK